MSIDKDQLREIIRDTLTAVGLHSMDAEELLMGTAAQESRLGTYFMQLGSGPALGIFQMEPNTLRDIWENYLKYKEELSDRIFDVLGVDKADVNALQADLRYQIIMARVHYLRKKPAIPDYRDLPRLAAYWKDHYNTHLGAGTREEFISNYHKYVS